MEYRQIVAVTGLPGLYQLVSTKNDGALVRSLADKSIKFVSSRVHQLTPLESIEIYTYSDNVRLHEVLEQIKSNDAPVKDLLSGKKASNDELKKYFATVLPEFDQERVYVSDIKKVLKWYELLKANDLLNFEIYQQSAENIGDIELTSTEASEASEAEEAPKKAAKKTAAKKEEAEGEEKPVKKAAKKSAKKEEGEGEEKPAKKAAAKKATKATAEGEEKPAKKAAKKKED